MSELMHKIEEDADREVLENKADFVTKLRELKKINLNLRGELGSYKMKSKACVFSLGLIITLKWLFNR